VSGQRLLEAERLLQASGYSHVVVRFAGIYGPGRERLLTSVRTGAPVPRALSNLTNRIHRDDCAGFLEHLLRLAAPEPLYVGVDDEPVELAVLLRWLAQATGQAAPAVDAAPVSQRGGNKRCSNRRLKETGYRLRYPTFREGYGALIGKP
jgi:nucleoside-diphosphate-sugar epimerase